MGEKGNNNYNKLNFSEPDMSVFGQSCVSPLPLCHEQHFQGYSRYAIARLSGSCMLNCHEKAFFCPHDVPFRLDCNLLCPGWAIEPKGNRRPRDGSSATVLFRPAKASGQSAAIE